MVHFAGLCKKKKIHSGTGAVGKYAPTARKCSNGTTPAALGALMRFRNCVCNFMDILIREFYVLILGIGSGWVCPVPVGVWVWGIGWGWVG